VGRAGDDACAEPRESTSIFELMRVVASSVRLLLCVSFAVSGCSGGTEPLPSGPGLHLVHGDGLTDTVQTRFAQALVAEVRDEHGALVPGVVVRFESVLSAPALGYPQAELLVGRLDLAQLGTFVTDTTDARGQTSVLVQLGAVAGTARAVVSAPQYGFVDTATYTVRPGKAARITLAVRDTATIVGGSYVIGAAAADRFGNPRPDDALTYTTTSGAASVDATGRVKGLAPGRASIAIGAGSFSDTAHVSVVPDGTLAVVEQSAAGRTITTVRLDGSQPHRLTTVTSNVMLPQWSPSGDRIVFYERDPNSDAQIWMVDLQGHRSLLTLAAPEPATQFFPRFSKDGQWLHFSGKSSGGYAWSLWRAHLDGTGLEPVAVASDSSYYEGCPSPNGARVAFNANGVISTVDLATGTIVSLGKSGDFPTYSPDGARIVYRTTAGQLSIMNADGTGARVLAGHTYELYASFGWSPDGKWIVVGGSYYGGVPDLVNAETLEVLPLTSLHSMSQPSFKP
jgi:hypothetical protein